MSIASSSRNSHSAEKPGHRDGQLSTPTPSLPGSGSTLSFAHLSYEVPAKGKGSKKLLVDDVSVTVKAGELLAIMGPSGAGKSTLLDLMAFRKTPLEGAVASLNAHPLTPALMHRLSTFVEQEDALLGVLTVRESVSYALRLHLPLLSPREVAARVRRVLAALGLQSCADQRIGTPVQRGVSGGQKRRVTAACAMVTFPRILLLDEVTSGLDSTSAREVMSAIRTLAVAEGMIVIATIHQPALETLAQFTDLLLLAGGKTCFSGKVGALEGFLERWGRPVGRFSTPSDHAMNFLNDDFAASASDPNSTSANDPTSANDEPSSHPHSSADDPSSPTDAPRPSPSKTSMSIGAAAFRAYYLSTLPSASASASASASSSSLKGNGNGNGGNGGNGSNGGNGENGNGNGKPVSVHSHSQFDFERASTPMPNVPRVNPAAPAASYANNNTSYVNSNNVSYANSAANGNGNSYANSGAVPATPASEYGKFGRALDYGAEGEGDYELQKSGTGLSYGYAHNRTDSYAPHPNYNSNSYAPNYRGADDPEAEYGKTGALGTLFWNTAVLCERTALNYARNLLAYGVRAGMYAGMGVMLATIWIQLGDADSTINDRLSVHFFSVAFLAFMSVAGIPGFLEERAVYYRESKNGLYTTLPFVLSNTLVNMPFLFVCTLLFTLISYWAIGLHPGGGAFFRFLIFLYLAILAAESQMLVIASMLPIFVAALAIGAFINGFWMSVGGYFIKARSLPRFWYYSFHYMDYQRYAFELLTNSDLRGLSFKCSTLVNGTCVCAYPTSTPETCTVSGADVLDYLDIGDISYGSWAVIVICITLIYRVSLYLALRLRSN